MSSVLDGIRVLEWAAWHQGPEAAAILGDLGADVIKIEDRVSGDPFRGVESLYGTSMSMPNLGGGTSIAFECVNRNKRSITLDLAKEKGKEVLYRLVSKSDVFLTNYSPASAEKLRVDYQSLVRHNPKLIYAIGSGLGLAGAERDKRIMDTIAQARSGIMFMISDRDHTEPYQMVGGVIDQLGGMVLAYAVVSALLARERHGVGQQVEASLLGSTMQLQLNTIGAYLFTGRARARHSRTRAKNPLTNQYKCGDGKWIMFAGFQSDRFWAPFCGAMGHPEMAQDPRFKSATDRSNNCKELIGVLDRIFASRPRAEWLAILANSCRELPCGPVQEIADLATDPEVLANKYITEFDHPRLGKTKVVGSPMHFSETPVAARRAAPAFGEHTEEVLLEVGGYTWDDLSRLKQAEVI